MDQVTLGRTGLRVGVAGLGCGGFSRLGLGSGGSEAQAVALVREALDLGVTLLDTAAAYGTEGVVGQAIKGRPRDSVVIATKAAIHAGTQRHAADQILASLDNSLRALGTDHVDVFQLHGVPPTAYGHAHEVIVPALMRAREQGKFRFLGITETAPNDHQHAMLQRAIPDQMWDTVMVGFHMLHQNARDIVFPLTQAHRVGTLLMFVVRQIFAKPERLAATLKELNLPGGDSALDFLVHPGGASDITDAAYRFVRHEPGVDVVLFGTGDRAHLRTNVTSILKPALPETDREKVVKLFGHLVGVGLDVPPAR